MRILSEIVKYEERVVKFALGNFGTALLNFAKVADAENTEISSYITEEISEKICQMLYIVDYGCKNNLDKSIVDLSKFYNKIIPNEIKNLDKKIRFIKSFDLRNQYRKIKKTCDISLSSFYEKSNVLWHDTPKDFELYSRNSLSYKDYLIEAKNKADRYKNLGCEDLYKVILNDIEQIESNMSDMFCGFHKISIKNASIILSKIHNYKLENDNNTHAIKYKNYTYAPKVCPIHELESIQTSKVSELVKKLEVESLFDHYLVVIPSYKEENICLSFDQELKLIQNNSMIPIIIGDRDGVCYFISYWL